MVYSPDSQKSWFQRRATGWKYLSTLPFRKLLTLYLAVFFLFATMGFYGDITYCGGRAPIWAVLAVGVFNGSYSVLYPFVLIHKPKVYLWLVALGSCILGPAFSTGMNYVAQHYPANFADRNTGIVLSAQGILLCIIASYSCFIGFTRAQASGALRIQNELDLAHGIQRTLVPPITTSLGGYDLHGISLPSDKVGGDLVDVVPVSNGGTVAYVADVSGHGLQAGILMGMIKTAVRTILLQDFDDPATLLHVLCDRLNRALPGVKEAHMYATLSALYLAPDGQVYYTLAAHPAILHYQAATRSVAQLACEQLPVGLLPVSRFISYSLQLEPGDILAITTDGILEAADDKEEEFGCDRVAALLGSQTVSVIDPSSANLEQTSRQIMQAVQAFGKQVDDQTLLLIRRQADAAMRQNSAA
jgi:hypothetical protein